MQATVNDLWNYAICGGGGGWKTKRKDDFIDMVVRTFVDLKSFNF